MSAENSPVLDQDRAKRIINIAVGAFAALFIFAILSFLWAQLVGNSPGAQNNCIMLDVSGEGHEIDIQTQGSVEEGTSSNTPKNTRVEAEEADLNDIQASIDLLKGKGNSEEQNQELQELLNDRSNQSRRTPRG